FKIKTAREFTHGFNYSNIEEILLYFLRFYIKETSPHIGASLKYISHLQLLPLNYLYIYVNICFYSWISIIFN
ncbi:hypothetical protein L9F63_012369, partial [Diploptera punctata]